MSVFDELRANLGLLYIAGTLPPEQAEREIGNNVAVKHALAMLDAFEQAHPGLVDETEPCGICGKPTSWRNEHGHKVACEKFTGIACNDCWPLYYKEWGFHG